MGLRPNKTTMCPFIVVKKHVTIYQQIGLDSKDMVELVSEIQRKDHKVIKIKRT